MEEKNLDNVDEYDFKNNQPFYSFATSFAYVLGKYKIESNGTATTSDSQDTADVIAKTIANSVAQHDANIISQTIDILNIEYDLPKRNNNPFIFNEGNNGLYYNWSSSVSNNYVCYSYSPGTTFITLSIINPTLELKQSEVLIFSKSDINDKIKKEPIYKIILPKYIQGIRSSLIIEDDILNPFVLLGTFSYPVQGKIINSYLFKWYFNSNKLEQILVINDVNSIRKIIRNKTASSDQIYLSTQNDTFNPIINSQIYRLNTLDVINYHTVELQNFLNTYILQFNNIPIYGSVWDFEIDLDQNIFISIPKISIDNTKLSGFNTRARLYYNKLDIFDNLINVNLLNLIGNDYYPAGFNENPFSTLQTQSNNTNKLILYSISDFLYQFLAILPKIDLIIKESFQIDNININTIQELIVKIRDLFKNLDVDGYKVLYLDKSDLYKDENPSIYSLIGIPPINTIDKSISINGNNNMYNVYAWQSTFDRDNDKIYIGSLDISESIYNGLIMLVKDTYPLVYDILQNLPENIKIVILDIFIEKPYIQNNLNDKKFFFDVIEIDSDNEVKVITTDGFKKSNPKLSDEGVRTLSIIKNNNGKFLSVGSTCYQPENIAKIYTLRL
jgi:hypothetical protein